MLDFNEFKDAILGDDEEYKQLLQSPDVSFPSLEESVIKHEGLRLEPYQDHLGNWTIGVGHKIKPDEQFDSITEDEAMSMLREDLQTAQDAARKIVPNFDKLDTQRQNVITEMVFQMGEGKDKQIDAEGNEIPGTGVRGFSHMRESLAEGDYAGAADNMLQSKWARVQTPKRANTLADIMRGAPSGGLGKAEGGLTLENFGDAVFSDEEMQALGMKPTPYESPFYRHHRGFGGDMVRLAAETGLGALETLENAANFYNPTDTPIDMVSKLSRFDILKPDIEEWSNEGYMGSWGELGRPAEWARSLGGSTAIAAVGFGAGLLRTGSPLGGYIGAITSLVGVMGTAEYQNVKETFLANGKSEEEAHNAALASAGWEVGGEAVAWAIPLIGIKGLTKVAGQPLKKTLGAMLKMSPKEIAVSFGKQYLGEELTEATQGVAQNRILRDAGLSDMSDREAFLQTVMPTLLMTGMFGVGAGAINAHNRNIIKYNINNLENPQARVIAAKAIYDNLLTEGPEGQQLANSWSQSFKQHLKDGTAVPFDEDFAHFADQINELHGTKPTEEEIKAGTVSQDQIDRILLEDKQRKVGEDAVARLRKYMKPGQEMEWMSVEYNREPTEAELTPTRERVTAAVQNQTQEQHQADIIEPLMQKREEAKKAKDHTEVKRLTQVIKEQQKINQDLPSKWDSYDAMEGIGERSDQWFETERRTKAESEARPTEPTAEPSVEPSGGVVGIPTPEATAPEEKRGVPEIPKEELKAEWVDAKVNGLIYNAEQGLVARDDKGKPHKWKPTEYEIARAREQYGMEFETRWAERSATPEAPASALEDAIAYDRGFDEEEAKKEGGRLIKINTEHAGISKAVDWNMDLAERSSTSLSSHIIRGKVEGEDYSYFLMRNLTSKEPTWTLLMKAEEGGWTEMGEYTGKNSKDARNKALRAADFHTVNLGTKFWRGVKLEDGTKIYTIAPQEKGKKYIITQLDTRNHFTVEVADKGAEPGYGTYLYKNEKLAEDVNNEWYWKSGLDSLKKEIGDREGFTEPVVTATLKTQEKLEQRKAPTTRITPQVEKGTVGMGVFESTGEGVATEPVTEQSQAQTDNVAYLEGKIKEARRMRDRAAEQKDQLRVNAFNRDILEYTKQINAINNEGIDLSKPLPKTVYTRTETTEGRPSETLRWAGKPLTLAVKQQIKNRIDELNTKLETAIGKGGLETKAEAGYLHNQIKGLETLYKQKVGTIVPGEKPSTEPTEFIGKKKIGKRQLGKAQAEARQTLEGSPQKSAKETIIEIKKKAGLAQDINKMFEETKYSKRKTRRLSEEEEGAFSKMMREISTKPPAATTAKKADTVGAAAYSKAMVQQIKADAADIGVDIDDKTAEALTKIHDKVYRLHEQRGTLHELGNVANKAWNYSDMLEEEQNNMLGDSIYEKGFYSVKEGTLDGTPIYTLIYDGTVLRIEAASTEGQADNIKNAYKDVIESRYKAAPDGYTRDEEEYESPNNKTWEGEPSEKNVLDIIKKVADGHLDSVAKEFTRLAKAIMQRVPHEKMEKVKVHYVPEVSSSFYDGVDVVMRNNHPVVKYHEAIHGITVNEMYANPKLYEEAVSIMEDFRAWMKENGFPYDYVEGGYGVEYAFKDIDEFLSQAAADTETQFYLKQHNAVSKAKSFWYRIVNFFRKALGLKPLYTNSLEKVFDLIGELGEGKREVLPRGNWSSPEFYTKWKGILSGDATQYTANKLTDAEIAKEEKDFGEGETEARKEDRRKVQKIVGSIGWAESHSKDFFIKAKDLWESMKKAIYVSTEELAAWPKYKQMMRQFEWNTMKESKRHLEMVLPFIDKITKLSENDRLDLEFYLLNSDFDLDKGKTGYQLAQEIIDRNNMQEEFKPVRKMLDELEARALKVGFNISLLKDYFPRHVKDYTGLMEYLKKRGKVTAGFDEFLREAGKKASKVGELSPQERAAFIANYIMKPTMPGVPKPSSTKLRSIAYVDKLATQYYSSIGDALVNHIYEMNEKIGAREAIGTENLSIARWMKQARDNYALMQKTEAKLKKRKEGGIAKQTLLVKMKQYKKNYTDAQNKIEAYQDARGGVLGQSVAELLAKEGIPESDRQKIAEIFHNRFTARGTHGWVQTAKNVGLMTTLGNPISAITQLGDSAWTLYQYGNLFKGDTAAFKGLAKALVGATTGNMELVDLFDFNSSQREFTMGRSTKALNKILTWSGLKHFDLFGKEGFLQAARESYRKMTFEEFDKKWSPYLKDTKTAYEGLQDGFNIGEKNAEGKYKYDESIYVLFNDLSEWQPISLSETPQYYQQGGQARVLYMLKLFAIKSLNNFLRETVKEWKGGNKIKALTQGLAFLTVFGATGAGADELKDLVLGRSNNVGDHFVTNLLQLALISRYNVEQGIQSGRLFRDVLSSYLPPTRILDDLAADIVEVYRGDKEVFSLDKKSTRQVPLIGRWYYDRYTNSGLKSEINRRKATIYKEAQDGSKIDYNEVRDINRLVVQLKRNDSLRLYTDVKPLTSQTINKIREDYRKKELERRNR